MKKFADYSLKTSIIILIIFSTSLFLWIYYDRTKIPETSPELIEMAEKYALEKMGQIPEKPFTYDGCTLLPENWFGHDLNSICIKHDIAYWVGGNKEEKDQADKTLKRDFQKYNDPSTSLLGEFAYLVLYFFGDTFVAEKLERNWGHGNK